MVLLEWLVFTVLLVAVLFGSAGQLGIAPLWIYVAASSAPMLIAGLGMHPDLARERMRPAPGGKDRLFIAIAQPLVLIHWTVAGLDVGRLHWSDNVPFVVQVVGFLSFFIAVCVGIWAMIVNRFFSSMVRIQGDRGHFVITAGPYKYVRHPGYAAFIGCSLFSGLALDSWWSILPAVGLIPLTIRRTAFEDDFLRERLQGYPDYAAIVPFRLLPGVW